MTSSLQSAPAAPARTRLPMLGLLALSFSVFLSITAEMMPTGLLPEMSAELGVSEGQIGLLVTIFAFTVVLTSTTLIRVTQRLPRHALMIAILVTLAVCNVLTAVMPSYGWIVAARVIGGLAHGMFWALTPAYAARLVPAELIGRAITIALTGGTLAMVLGVPLGTALGHAVGWRFAFAGVAVALLIGAIAVAIFLPRVPADPADPPREEGAPRSRNIAPIALLCVVVALTMTGYYSFLTYIAPFLLDRVGLPVELLSVALLVFGAAGALSLVFTGGILTRYPIPGVVIGLAGITVTVSIVAVSAHIPWLVLAAMGLWGFFFGLVPPLAQTTMLRSATPRQRDTAGAFYTTAFNVGIGGGALVGAVLLENIGLGALPVFAATLTAVALILFLISRRTIVDAVARNS
ncbi:MFS transporter [Mycetocola spongiae]|uniref:MFS transporter n=1 Tax=Mycetocola spongiae TaxID=2859226 RepID=UPI001CF25696|nr:MFS transporter [Mycetocola spongiae]UCR88717.1 MFS transporter [Mycetocola spongiae]